MRHLACCLLQILVFLGVLTGCSATSAPQRDGDSGLKRPATDLVARAGAVHIPAPIDIIDDPGRSSVSYYGPWIESGSDADKYRYLLAATRPRGTEHVSYWVLFNNIYVAVTWRDWNRLTLEDGRILEMKAYNRDAGVCSASIGFCGYSERLEARIARIYLTAGLRLKACAKQTEFIMQFPAGYVESLIAEVEADS